MSAKVTTIKPATDNADAVRQAYLAEVEDRQFIGERVPLPNGARAEMGTNITAVYQGFDATKLLGNPEHILKEPKPTAGASAFKYVWRKRVDNRTAAWVRAGILRPVSVDEVDPENPLAEYVTDRTTEGDYVSWEGLGLFEMPPKWVKRIYDAPAEWSIARTAAIKADWEQRVRQSTGGNYEGSFTASNRGKT